MSNYGWRGAAKPWTAGANCPRSSAWKRWKWRRRQLKKPFVLFRRRRRRKYEDCWESEDWWWWWQQQNECALLCGIYGPCSGKALRNLGYGNQRKRVQHSRASKSCDRAWLRFCPAWYAIFYWLKFFFQITNANSILLLILQGFRWRSTRMEHFI